MFKTILLIGLGGFVGTVSRYLLTVFIDRLTVTMFPAGTFIVNILGCFLIGIIMGFAFREVLSGQLRLLLATGFCGSFTTFSTYSLEIFQLYQKGEVGLSMAYLAGSIIVGLFALLAGLWIAKSLSAN